MLRSRFLWQLYAGYVVLIIISTFIVGGLISQKIERSSMEEIHTSLEARAILLKHLAEPFLLKADSTPLQKRISLLGKEIGTRLTIVTADGKVIADSEKDPLKMDDHSSRPEILSAKSSGLGISTRFSDTLHTKMMYLALTVKKNKKLIGYVRSSLPLSVVDKRLSELRSIIIFGASSSIVVALLIGFFFARYFASPIATMTSIAESMAGGDYSKRLPLKRTDEIGKLAQALNHMAQSSRDRMETIATERNKLQAILAGMVEGVIAVDKEERILHLNRVAGLILGTVPEKSIGKKVWEISRAKEIYETLSNVIQNITDVKRRVHLIEDTTEKIIEIHSSPLRDTDGNIVGAVMVLHDVSELQKLETVRRDFVANVSHELKTPITAIRGLIETIIDDESITSDNRDRFLTKIDNQSTRLSAIVTDLLTLSRLESDRDILESLPVNLNTTVLESIHTLNATAEAKSIKMETEIPDAYLIVSGDKAALSQAVSNLLDNALKYTPANGHIWVRLKKVGANALIEVQDSGVGIEPVHSQRIFERFYRVDKARSRELGGTGLGLSIVKHIALSHNGQISLEGSPGNGSTFRITIPLALPTA